MIFYYYYKFFEDQIILFNLCNILNIFQYFVNNIFCDYLDDFLIFYIDNFLIYSNTLKKLLLRYSLMCSCFLLS